MAGKTEKTAPVKKGRDLYTIISQVEKGIGAKKDNLPLYILSDVKDDNKNIKVEVISFGDKSIDDATNIGGVPRGRIIEIYGPEQSGKSWLAMRLVATAQKMGLTVAYLDIENAMDADWVAKNGIQLDKLIYGRGFKNGEQAIDAVRALCNQKVDLIVLDSTAALVPKSELEGSMQDATVAELARMMSKGVRIINDLVGKTGSTVVFINQLRMKAGFVLGNPEETPGGKALKFYSSMRLDVRAREKIKGAGGKYIGVQSRMKVVKNKVAPPFGESPFQIMFKPDGLSALDKLIQKALQYKIIRTVKDENDEENKLYVIGKGKNQVETGCDDLGKLGEWLTENSQLEEVLGLVEEKATEDGVQLDDDILALVGDGSGQEVAAVSEEETTEEVEESK